MKETIAELLKIEEQAKKIVADAAEESAEIVRKARAEAAKIQEHAQRSAQAKAAQLLGTGLEAAKQERLKILEEIDRENENLRNIPAEKKEAALRLVASAVAESR